MKALDTASLEAMQEAARRVRESNRVLVRTGASVLTEVLGGKPLTTDWAHFPEGDIFDQQSASQFYFHAHEGRTGEAGHFHTFLRAPAIRQITGGEVEDTAVVHLIAVAIDRFGQPVELFTTNRWVTGETWFPAETVIAALERFEIDHAAPSWPLNIWITDMLRLFRPDIIRLVEERDVLINNRLAEGASPEEVFEDRDIEVCSSLRISLDRQFNKLNAELARRG
jgi:hypothetical protein